jgi:TonB-dependent SusC/RagA subfamily outer membrane receptor
MKTKPLHLRSLATAFLLLFTILTAFTQERTITGKITKESTGEPITGVNILLKGTTSGTISDINGDYSLNAITGDILVYSTVGFSTIEIEVSTQSVINVQLREDIQQLEEVVVIGYTNQSKRNISGAISVVDPKDLNTIPASNINQQLQGRAPGVNVLTTGRPGGPVTVNIRGFSTINDNNPLYIIDGMPADWESVAYMNPYDVESIQILKDPSTASIYGARAANGVIILTTKSGKNLGDTRISFDGFFGVTDFSECSKPRTFLNCLILQSLLR